MSKFYERHTIFRAEWKCAKLLQTRAGDALDDLEDRGEILLAQAPPHPRAVELGR
jgi:hypothetical protein